MSSSRPLAQRVACALLCAAAASVSTSCYGTRVLTDPVLEIDSATGRELGVSTEYGVVFLGRTVRSGYVEITAWYGDGPSVESTVVEPVGGGLFTAETEIRLPSIPMTFFQPQPGEELVVAGRTEDGPWEEAVEVRTDPRVYGILLEIPEGLDGRDDQIGAAVFADSEGDGRRLIGLVSGRLRLSSTNGTRDYLTVVGPDQLWRLVTHRRDRLQRKPWIYRDDIL